MGAGGRRGNESSPRIDRPRRFPSVRHSIGRTLRRLGIERDAYRVRNRVIDLALFHEFALAPAGGGNQSLRALLVECTRRGVLTELNVLSPSTDSCLFNSFNFDVERLRLL